MRKLWIMLGIAVFFLTGCVFQVQPLQIEPQRTEYALVSFQQAEAKHTFKITNPNDIPLAGLLQYKLKVNGKEIFTGQSADLTVAAQESQSFTVSSKIDLAQTFGTIKELLAEIKNGGTEIPYQLEGVLKAEVPNNWLNLPIEKSFELSGAIPLPQIPEVQIIGFENRGLTASGLNLLIKAKIVNKNKFPLKFNSLNYNLLPKNGESLLAGTLERAVEIPAQGSGELAWQVKLNYSSLANDILTSIKNNQFDFKVEHNFSEIQ